MSTMVVEGEQARLYLFVVLDFATLRNEKIWPPLEADIVVFFSGVIFLLLMAILFTSEKKRCYVWYSELEEIVIGEV